MEIPVYSADEVDRIASGFEEVRSGKLLAAKVRHGKYTPSHVKYRSAGKADVAFPWLPSGYNFTPFGVAELVGAAIAPDSLAHRDHRPRDIMNIHAAVAETAIARFAALPDELHDDNLETGAPLASLTEQGYEVAATELLPDDVLIFMGGRTTHEFTSANPARLSIVKSFQVQPK